MIAGTYFFLSEGTSATPDTNAAGLSETLWWLAPVLALIGALLGGVIAAWTNGLVAERRTERALVRDARLALERWNATRVGPSNVQYEGLSAELLAAVSDQAHRRFFDTHFAETTKAKAALGAVRHLDGRIAEVVDLDDWLIPHERVPQLREALSKAEARALWGRRVRRE